MTDFRSAYKVVHDSVVGLGFVSGHWTAICGTGFVAHADEKKAIVFTNEHVVTLLNKPPKPEAQAAAIAFRTSLRNDANGQPVPFTQIVRYAIPYWGLMPKPEQGPTAPIPGIETIAERGYENPDFGLAIVDCQHAHPLPTATCEFHACPDEGLPMALLGYPGGVVIAPDTRSNVLQCTPILQSGTLSAVLPNRAAPHRILMAHIHSGPGCSGSPLFDATGKVWGVVFGMRAQPDPDSRNPAPMPSSQLLAVPLTELPPEFSRAVESGQVAELYEWLEATSRAANEPAPHPSAPAQ